MEDLYWLTLTYQWSSFDNKIEINSLKEALNWIRQIWKQFDNKIEIYILPFENGSFKFWIKDYKDIYKNVIWWVITAWVSGLIGLTIFTKWEEYKIDVSNSTINWNIIIINNNWEKREFSQSVLPYVWNTKINDWLKKIVSPLNNNDDELILNSPWHEIAKILYTDKQNFINKETEDLLKIRWFIYEMNIKRKTFKVLLASWDYFMVKVPDKINIWDIQPYLWSDSLELEWKIIKTITWEIKKMNLYWFSEIQQILIKD